NGVLDYTIQLGYDGSIFPEMNYFYANGKIKEYVAKDVRSKNEGVTEIEQRYMSGNLKSSWERLGDSEQKIFKMYYPNGNVRNEFTIFENPSMNEVNSFYTNGLLSYTAQIDKEFGNYG